jgi:hypothetical protein
MGCEYNHEMNMLVPAHRFDGEYIEKSLPNGPEANDCPNYNSELASPIPAIF